MIGWLICSCFIWLCGFMAAMFIDQLITHQQPRTSKDFVQGWRQGYRVGRPKKDLITGRFVA